MKKFFATLMCVVAMTLAWNLQAQVVNYTCNFDSDSDTTGWVLANGSAVNHWTIDTGVYNSASKSLYITNGNAANSYTVTSASYVYAYREFTLGAGQYSLTFDWKANGESSWDYLRVFLVPATTQIVGGAMPSGYTSTNAFATATPAGWIDMVGGKKNLQTNWVTEFGEATVEAGTYRLLFVWMNDGSGGAQSPAAVDNIQFSALTCPHVTGVTATVVSNHDVSITWTPVGTESSWCVSGDGNSTVVTSTSYTFSNLDANTPYSFRVRAICGDGDTSVPAVLNVRTTCAPLSELPYYQGFEGYATGSTAQFPSCMTRINDATGTINYYPYVSASNARSGSQALYWYNTTTATYASNMYMVLPGVDLNTYSVDGLELVFYAKYSSNPSNLIVGVMTNPNDAATFVPVDTVTVNTGDYSEFIVSLANYNGNGAFVAVRAPRSTITSTIYMDDVTLREPNSCAAPILAHSSSVSSSEINYVWSDTASVGEYKVYFGLEGFDPDTVAPLSVYDTTVSFSNLLPNTTYECYVTTVCSGGESYPTDHIFTRTACVAVDSLPYTEDFEAYASGAANPISPCWAKGTNSTTKYPYPYTTAACTGSRGLYFYSSHPTSMTATSFYSYAALPSFTADLNTLRVSFDMKRYSSTSATYTSEIYVGVMSNPNDISTFDTIAYIDMYSVPGNTIVHHQVLFSDYEGTGSYIAFLAAPPRLQGTNTYAYNYGYIDNVVVDAPNCFTPINVHASNVDTTSVDIIWNANTSDSYEILMATNEDFSNAQTISESSDSAHISGLTSNTTYYFKVRGLCGLDSSDWCNVASFHTLINCGEGFANLESVIDNATSSSYSYVIYSSSSYPYTDNWILYTPEQLAETGIFTNNYINSISLKTGTINTPQMPLKIYMAMTNRTEWASATDTMSIADMQLVYDGTPTFVGNSWCEIPLDSTFQYIADSSIAIRFVRNQSISSSNYFYYASSPNKMIYRYRSSATATSSPYRYSYQGAIKFNVCSEIPSCERPTGLTVVDLTDNMAKVRWNGTASSYQMVYSTSLMDPDTALNVTTVAADSVVLSNLAANTTYYVYVRSNCSGSNVSDWSLPRSFTTACSAQAVPYTEDFEAYASGSANPIDPCWKKGTNSTVAYPYPYTTAAITGSRGLYFYSYHPSTTTSTAYFCYAALPMMVPSIDSLQLTFDLKRYTTTTSSYTSELYIGVMSDPTDLSTFDTVAFIDGYSNPGGSVNTYDVSFANYHGQGRYIAIYAAVPQLHDGASLCYNYAYVDNILVDYIPSCPRVSSVHAIDSTITTTSAEITWQSNSPNAIGYEVEYGTTGFVPGTGTSVVVTGTPAQIMGLSPSTPYQVYVRAICGAGDTSAISSVCNFSTQCGALTQLPVTYSFDTDPTGSAAQFPHCWTRCSGVSASYNYYPYVYSSSTYAHSGSNCLYFYATTTTTYPATMIAVLPELNTTVIPINQVEMSFWARTSSNTGRLTVGAMTDPTDSSTFVPLAVVPVSNTLEVHRLGFSGYTGNAHYLAIKANRGATSMSYYVDDVTLEQASPCPRAFDLTVDGATSTTSTISWSDTNNSSSWVLTYWPENNSAAAQTITVNTNPYTVTGLTHSTNYVYNVRPLCGDGDTALAARENGRFATTQIPATIPYNYDFENAAEWGNWQTNSNNNVNWNRGTAAAGQGTYGAYISADNGATNGTISGTVNAAAYRDFDFGTVDTSYILNFKARVGGTVANRYDALAVMLVNPGAVVAASGDNITSPWGNVNDLDLAAILYLDTNWTNYTVSLDFVSGTKRLAFYWFNQTTANFIGTPAAIDDINIEYAACPRPADLAVNGATINESSATLSWRGNTDVTYEIIYRKATETSAQNVFQTVSSATSYTLTGLQPTTTYYAWVRKFCGNDTSMVSGGVQFTTTNTLYHMPLVNDFEGEGTFNFTLENGTNTNAWIVGSAENADTVAGNALYISNDNGATAAYTISAASVSYAVADVHIDSGIVFYSYDWKCQGESTFDFMRVALVPATVDIAATTALPTGVTATSLPSNWISLDHNAKLNLQNTWQHVEDSLVVSVSGNYHFVYMWRNDASVGTAPGAVIDNVMLYRSLEVCNTPVVTVEDVTYEGATISWELQGNNYEVAVTPTFDNNWPASTVVNGGTYTFTGLYPSTQYTFRVRQNCDSLGYSDWFEGQFTTDSLPCFAPSAVTTSGITVNSVVVNWTDDAQSRAANWVVNVFNSTTNVMDTVSSKPATISGLYDNTDYSVSVRALCSDLVYSDWSDTASFSTLNCQAVSGVQVSNITTTGATITWAAGANETSWEVSYGDMDFTEGNGTNVTVTSNSYTMTGLQENNIYDVYVRAICAAGITSDWSPKVQFTTPQSQGIDGVDGSYSLSIYPNPTSGNTTISLRGIEGEVVISVVDMNGRTISSETLNCGSDCTKTMNVESLAQGTYFVRVLGDGINSVRKLIVR